MSSLVTYFVIISQKKGSVCKSDVEHRLLLRTVGSSVLLSVSSQFLETNGTDFVIYILFFHLYRHSPLVGQGLLIIEASRSHSHTPHSVELLWTCDRPNAETSLPDNTQHTHRGQTAMPSALFEPAISASERSKTHVLDREATGIGLLVV
jgi:hypothetical protein